MRQATRLLRRTSIIPAAAAAVVDPTSIANLFAWYKADALTLNNADPVSSWTDSSGNSRHATQATSANQPLFRTNVLNSKPIIEFDGTNDLLQVTYTLAQPVTRMAVLRYRSTTAGQASQDGGANIAALFDIAGTGYRMYAGNGLQTGTVDTSYHIFCQGWNGASSTLRVDGGAGVAGDAGSATQGGITFGARAAGTQHGQVNVAETLVYSRMLTLSEINDLGNYFASRYALTWNTAT